MDENVPSRPPIGMLLRLLHQHYAADIETALRASGFDDLRPAHANVFPFVPAAGITVSALAELAGVRKQTMAEAVEQLERLGYVERRENPDDGRSRLVFLTDRGRSVPPVTHGAADHVEAQWAELTGAAELEALRDALMGLLGGLRQGPPSAGTS
jgi:DNA-binding MarR family transcriptional regulator